MRDGGRERGRERERERVDRERERERDRQRQRKEEVIESQETEERVGFDFCLVVVRCGQYCKNSLVI